MKLLLTPGERQRALSIKAAIESAPFIQNRPDLEYAHLALCCSPNMSQEALLETAHKLQCFREQYGIQETVEDGVRSLRELMMQQPGHILDISYVPSEQTYHCVSDFAKLDPSKVQSEKDYRVYQSAFYYIMRATSTSPESMRKGLIISASCEGMTLRSVNVQFQERCVAELWNYYPALYKEITWYNTPTAANMMYSMIRKFMTKEFRDNWKVGAIGDYEGRLDSLFAIPTLEDAQEQVLQRVESYLQERYHNEQHFRLEQIKNVQSQEQPFAPIVVSQFDDNY
ncbi:expressed unknown protein [Seminavis robusta]|uniref:CRAL-TRIO domain-containing protein n=1 Tax=Seminavis robusta TaxID=568900 RepID=A0A9N8ET05_9STRA|nr:expressed unknown protein [Seminavis robusta]|eukprot:Sro1874_g302980.1 n/a (284) ;mRNA; f:13605-14456